MKNYFVIVLTILLINNGWTQNTNLDYKNAVKIYNLTTQYEHKKHKSGTGGYSTRNTEKTQQILHPTIAFQWKAMKNNFHEIELTNFKLNKAETQTEIVNDSTGNGQLLSGNGLITTLISIRYEYVLNFNISKEKKFVSSLGFGINPYFRQNIIKPKISTLFPASEFYLGARSFIIPRLTYYVKPKLFIDINFPLCFFETYYLSDKDDNPGLTAQQRTTTTYNYEQFPKIFSGRIGLGLKL